MHINPDTKFVLQKMSVKDGLSVPAINHLEEKVSFDSNDTIEGFYVMNMDETVSSDEGEYTIDSRVMERGGTSMVFKGRNKEGKPIAVKIGEPFFYNDDVFGDSAESVFIREALVAKQLKLQHPDLLIPDVLDYTVVTVDSTNLKGDRNEEDDWEAQESCPALVTQWIDGDKLYDNYGVHRFKNSEELIETFE
ncbi:MAG TPA: hypothetical protein VHA74_02930, partial [Candidatus Dojkabacteria bacterium]|nr:hypothetical protein [Candidatus Dojkabacteria bacterium]